MLSFIFAFRSLGLQQAPSRTLQHPPLRSLPLLSLPLTSAPCSLYQLRLPLSCTADPFSSHTWACSSWHLDCLQSQARFLSRDFHPLRAGFLSPSLTARPTPDAQLSFSGGQVVAESPASPHRPLPAVREVREA